MHTQHLRYSRPQRVIRAKSRPSPGAGTTGYWSALSYLVKSFVGPGCLALAAGFSRCGLGLGLAAFVTVLAITTRNMFSLVLCQRGKRHIGVRTYADLARVSIGPSGEVRELQSGLTGVALGGGISMMVEEGNP